MTKWARMRRRKERRRAEEASKSSTFVESEAKLAEPEKISDDKKHHQETQKVEARKDSKPNPILSQIPGYAYLVAIFVLLSGIFFPLITTGAGGAYSFAIGGAAVLFLGLAGGILVFKSTTSVKSQGVFLAIGFALIVISLALIFLLIEMFQLEFIRG